MKLKKISGFQIFSVFYLITGIILLAVLIQYGSILAHLGLLGALSLIVFYGLYAMKKWALYLTVSVSLLGISFGSVNIYAVSKLYNMGLAESLVLLALTLYVIILFTSILYVIVKREKFR